LLRVGVRVVAAVITADRLGTAELEGAAHEFLAVQFTDCAASFLDGAHGDKGESFGTLGAVVHHDLGIADTTDAVEELEEIALGSIVGQIADIEALGRDIAGVRRRRSLAAGFRLTGFTVLAGLTWRAGRFGWRDA
jgi:hypothetical protein